MRLFSFDFMFVIVRVDITTVRVTPTVSRMLYYESIGSVKRYSTVIKVGLPISLLSFVSFLYSSQHQTRTPTQTLTISVGFCMENKCWIQTMILRSGIRYFILFFYNPLKHGRRLRLYELR